MSELLLTPLNDLHIDLGAKMVSFADYSMPVQYYDGIVKEHLHTREKSSLFDVSHMGQLILSGKGIDKALEKILPIDVVNLKIGRQRYSFFTLENGGILDDLMLARIDENSFYMVVNASRKSIDLIHLQKYLNDFNITEINDHALIAIQGPKSSQALENFIPGVSEMKFMDSKIFNVSGDNCRVSRSGYTGEDGYEISIPSDKSIFFAKKLLAHTDIKPAGLGARDSLRLEAGLCLYGNDINETTTPNEADLLWAIQKTRKIGGEREGGFIGDNIIFSQISNGVKHKRVGFTIEGKVPVRSNTEIFDKDNNKIGYISSGGFSPTSKTPIAMGYINSEHSAIGTEVIAKARKKEIKLTVSNMPAVAHHYYK